MPLPIYEIEPALLAAWRSTAERRRFVIEAPTGSGKSTQLPQMLLKNDLLSGGEVIILQPRRIAARMLARRVAEETGTRLGEEVGYQVRFEGAVSARTVRSPGRPAPERVTITSRDGLSFSAASSTASTVVL